MSTRTLHPYLDHPGPIPFAHRGGSADGLENTLPQFRRAVNAGYRYIETDVHATADGRLVAFHDTTLDRVTDGAGRIADLPWDDVRQARVAGKEPVPLFEDLLEEFPETRWNVDVKAEPALVPLLDLIDRTDAWDRVCVGSFSEARVTRAQHLAGPRLATSFGTRGCSTCGCARGACPPRCAARRSRPRSPRHSRACRWSTVASYGRPTRAGYRCTCGP